MKKLADNYETLVFVSKRYPSSMSRLKNLLMLEGVSETSARRKIADLETEAWCLMVERQKIDLKTEKENYERSHSMDKNFYLETSRKTDVCNDFKN